MKRGFFFLLATFFTLIISCEENEGVNYHFEALQIKSVEMPEVFNYGEVYKIKVTYFRPNNCTFFEGFDVAKEEETTRKVVAIGSVLEDDNECAATDENFEAYFNFEVLYDQPYIFRYWTGEDANGEPTYLEITVPVNEDNSGLVLPTNVNGSSNILN